MTSSDTPTLPDTPVHPAAEPSADVGFTLSSVRLAELDLEPSVQAGVAAAGFTQCTPIQAAALPLALAGRDVAGQAQTGTGKTAAFMLPLMNRLLRSAAPAAGDGEPAGAGGRERPRTQPRAVVLAPTRELALQIHRDAELLGRFTGLRFGVVYGGTGYDEQREMLRAGLEVLIGTPGRLIDYLKQRLFDLGAVEVVVLDEADRMLDLGFIRDMRYILRRMPGPERRLNMLFSATLSYRVTELAYEHMNNPEVVNVSPEKVTVDEVTQTLYHVGRDEKMALLLGLLRRMDVTRTIVFTNTRHMAERVADVLAANGYDAGLLSGDVPQRTRMKLLARFQAGELPIVVATDVAARGLHIEDVSHVFNFDLPQDAEDYVHRIGRTARGGARGDAMSFACEEFVFSLEDIEAYIGQHIPVAAVSDDLLVAYERPPRRPRRAKGPGAERGARSGDSGRTRGEQRRSGGPGRKRRRPRPGAGGGSGPGSNQASRQGSGRGAERRPPSDPS